MLYFPIIRISRTSNGEVVILRHPHEPVYEVAAYQPPDSRSRQLIATNDLAKAEAVFKQSVEEW